MGRIIARGVALEGIAHMENKHCRCSQSCACSDVLCVCVFDITQGDVIQGGRDVSRHQRGGGPWHGESSEQWRNETGHIY